MHDIYMQVYICKYIPSIPSKPFKPCILILYIYIYIARVTENSVSTIKFYREFLKIYER